MFLFSALISLKEKLQELQVLLLVFLLATRQILLTSIKQKAKNSVDSNCILNLQGKRS